MYQTAYLSIRGGVTEDVVDPAHLCQHHGKAEGTPKGEQPLLEVAEHCAELLLQKGHAQKENRQVDEDSSNNYQVVQIRTCQANHSEGKQNGCSNLFLKSTP